MAKPQPNLKPVEAQSDGAANCKALGRILDRIGDKWTIMVVGALSHGPMRLTRCSGPSRAYRIAC